MNKNKLLNDALRAKGYAGPDIKIALTDVKDPNGPFYTDTLTNVVVFDRKMLASLDRDKILNILGHEFGHYSKEDNKTGTQTIANYSGDKLEDRTKAMVSKEATEDTLASIRNNLNVITGEEGKKLAESIPTERREYYTLEYFGTGGVASKKIASGGRVSLTESYYTSFDTENDRATKYTATTISVGAGDDDLSVAAGFGFYFSDSPEEIQKLSTSAGGSITLFGWSVGLDGLSKGNYDKDFLKKIKNIEGVRFYVGTGFIPLKKEFHISFLDYGKPISEAKYKSYNEYYKTRTLPSQIRNYYDNYYNGDKKMDNIKIQNDKNKITIKKGIIKKKYLVLFLLLKFPIMPILFAILKNFGAFENHELLENIFMYEILCGWIIIFVISCTGTLFFHLSLEKIEIIKDKKLINIIGDGVNLKLNSKNKIKVGIYVTKEHFIFTRANFKEMCTMTFIIDNDKKYKWGFRISEEKAEEIKKILEDIEVEFNE